MREITVYEEDDPSHMFGFCDHVNRVTVFEVRKSGVGYDLIIDGQLPEFVWVNGKIHQLLTDEDLAGQMPDDPGGETNAND
ncbi:hypothetical protein SEA_PHALCONET_92 [Mycobacterium phage Phalconet]|uniref:Uncharacterized protein n=2 Tax=Gracegardnervirinae TaxID=2946632 RepID=A0A2D1GA03_9CAUD|nr:hypothetical protein SEAGREEN_92 [Mycobacterium phage Seagreen]YP_009636504.1 hypothetical protein FGG21_gp091 [Mycobacterium phage DLane]YP_009963801.1 hypothetical protein I5I02_gp103 [Mycobacterium phage Demsculpinboyz]UXE03979.1 hypothetical protein SEA_PHALCONET_92 [Mycobacterium phage Phalconet]AEK08635.1 hypothetical protein PBI_DLANE_91 [Mycobacterium phage DLane]ALA48735.1 hypothetical protein SEAGREEN_92 [Mycobacterium phage Seagreen]ATN88698.1 hypothetical protein SEA_DEMSCULPIN